MRNKTIDLFRFIFAWIIVLYHSFFIVSPKVGWGGYICVEFYFIVSGYLMAHKACKCINEDIGVTTYGYLKKKFLSILPYFGVAAFFSIIIYAIFSGMELTQVVRNVFYSLFEVFLLQMYGFHGYWPTGVAWYLSSLFIALAIIFPVEVKYKKNFTCHIAPLIVLAIYGYLCYIDGHINTPDKWMGITYKGNLRAVAGVTLGCISYDLSDVIRKLKITNFKKIIISICEFTGYAIVICSAFIRTSEDDMDFLIIFCLFVSVTFSFSNQSILTEALNRCSHRFWKYIGTFSMCIYFNHFYWSANLSKIFPDSFYRSEKILIYLLIVGVTASVDYMIVGVWKRVRLKNKCCG